MKKLLCLALALCLFISLTSALAENATGTDLAASLPAVGETVNGFVVRDTRDVPFLGATMVLFEHERTGAGLTYIANDDTNRVFDLTFLTRPIDETGLPHVFEHSTLNGSEKYPSSALFFNLSYQTYNTYMNAYTMSVLTSYPVASLSEAQLLKYADFYTDSCLHPMVLQNESIYREEAWRYRLASAEDELTLEGTVYSEMLGATDLDEKASFNATKAAFPGSVAGYSYGGDPDYIPDMTWEALKEYHARFYHPSNCMGYLYGSFEHYEDFLALLDEAFAPYEKSEFTFEDSGYTPLTESVTSELPFPVEATSSTENASTIYYTIICPGLRDSAEEELVLNTLTDVLVADASPLMQALRKAFPAGSFASYIQTDAPEDAIVFVGRQLNQGDAELFRDTVNAALNEVAEKGFDPQVTDSVMANLATTTLLTREGKTVGTDTIQQLAYSYATSGDPYSYIDYVEALGKINTWNEQGIYQTAVAKWLTGSPVTALTTTYPVPGEKEAHDAALAESLAAYKASLSEEEIAALVEATNAEKEAADASAYVAQLQAVTVSSLPEEVALYDITDESGEDGVRYVDATAGVDEIGKTALFIDAAGLPQEMIHWFKLYTELLGELDTAQHTRDELDALTTRYLYSGEHRLSLLGDKDEYHPYFRMGWIATDADQQTAYDLMYEIAYETDFTNTQKLGEALQQLKASLKSTITNSIYNIEIYRGLAVFNPLYRYYNYINYLDYYAFLEQVATALEASPEAVVETLTAVQQFLHNRGGAIAGYAGNADSIALNRPMAEAFMARLDSVAYEPVAYDLPVPARREAIIIDSGAQFNALVGDYAAMGLEDYDGGLDALTSLVADKLLIPQLREQYGVYTPLHGAISDGGVYLLAYRDPNVAETFAVYDSLADQVAALAVDQDTLDGYILSSYAYYATSAGELTGAVNAMVAVINGDAQDENLEYMRQLKQVTPEAVARYADIYRGLSENGVRATAGSAAAINANADMYDVILNPFGTQDATQVAFDDVTEDHPYYANVRRAFENGMMAPLTEGTFGVDEEATAGELAVALFKLAAGQDASAQDALDTLGAYGVMSGMTADEVLTHGSCDQVLVDFLVKIAGAQGVTADEPNEQTDLPMTRGELAEQLDMLMQMFGM